MSTEATSIHFRGAFVDQLLKKPNFDAEFAALQATNEQRAAYGLRYNDYNRYRLVNMEVIA